MSSLTTQGRANAIPMPAALLLRARLHRDGCARGRRGRRADRPRLRRLHREAAAHDPQRAPDREDVHDRGRPVVLARACERRPRAVRGEVLELSNQISKAETV